MGIFPPQRQPRRWALEPLVWAGGVGGGVRGMRGERVVAEREDVKNAVCWSAHPPILHRFLLVLKLPPPPLLLGFLPVQPCLA